MFQARRPAGRLFYLVVAVVVAAWGVRPAACAEGSAGKAEKPAISPEAEPRAKGPAARAASPSPQSGGGLTSVIDTVYMADGSAAQGVLVITWPAFCDGERGWGGSGSIECDAGNGRGFECCAGAERGSDACECVLHRGLPVGARRGANGVLGGADKFSGNSGPGADDAGNGNGGAASLHAVREHGAGSEGER